MVGRRWQLALGVLGDAQPIAGRAGPSLLGRLPGGVQRVQGAGAPARRGGWVPGLVEWVDIAV
jgi:hypothetical protein